MRANRYLYIYIKNITRSPLKPGFTIFIVSNSIQSDEENQNNGKDEIKDD
jgi:hypothetical protein